MLSTDSTASMAVCYRERGTLLQLKRKVVYCISDRPVRVVARVDKSPVPVKGMKSSTVTSTPISAKTSTAARRDGSSLLQSTPSMSNSTAETFPHAPVTASVCDGEDAGAEATTTSRRPLRGSCGAAAAAARDRAFGRRRGRRGGAREVGG